MNLIISRAGRGQRRNGHTLLPTPSEPTTSIVWPSVALWEWRRRGWRGAGRRLALPAAPIGRDWVNSKGAILDSGPLIIIGGCYFGFRLELPGSHWTRMREIKILDSCCLGPSPFLMKMLWRAPRHHECLFMNFCLFLSLTISRLLSFRDRSC